MISANAKDVVFETVPERKTILLVEDDAAHSALILRAFEAHYEKMDVVVVRSLLEARREISRWRPDLLISDLILRDGSGMDLLGDDATAAGIPIVIMTCQGDEQSAVKAMKLGALDYVVKTPASLAEMPRAAQRIMREWALGVEHAEAQRILAKREEFFRMMVEHATDVIAIADPDGTSRYTSPAIEQVLGYSPEEFEGQSIFDHIHPDDTWMLRQAYSEITASPGQTVSTTHRHRHRDGTWRVIESVRRMVCDADGNSKVIVNARDVTAAHELSQRLSYQASHDDLTGLVNRREFEKRLDRILSTARSEQSQHALCYLDLDQFKIINDTCGHVAGDELLRELGRHLPQFVRKRDTFARLGGDEFGVLMEHCSLKQAERVALQILKAVEQFRFVWDEEEFTIGVSIGLVPIESSDSSASELMKAADAACYGAKEEGRSRIRINRPHDVELHRRFGEMQWATRIVHAIEHDALELEYQQIYPVAANGEDGLVLELLLRMRAADGTQIAPTVLLSAAERYNLATKIDHWVVRRALEWLAEDSERLTRVAHCGINLSGHSLNDEQFLAHVIHQLDETGVPTRKVVFEITETAAIRNLRSATHLIGRLRDLGCRFALDDFGSGLSSFAYLKALPVDIIKIDGLFVRDMADDPLDFAMVRSINEIAQLMGKATIAESVECEATMERLREIGVDYAQGFWLEPPRPLTELSRYSAASSRDTGFAHGKGGSNDAGTCSTRNGRSDTSGASSSRAAS